jgi:hypothetical protein
MTVLRNNFDGGPHGTVITTANSAQGGDDFDAVSVQGGGGAIFQYKSATLLGVDRPTAEFVLHCYNGATAAQEAVQWSTSMGTQTQIWWRLYCYFETLPPGPLNPTIFECDNGAAFTGSLDIQAAVGEVGTLKLWNGPGTVSDFSTNVMPTDQWVRLEGRYQYGTGTSGSADVRIFLEADSETPTETLSISACNMGAVSSTTWTWGYPFSRANQPNLYLSGCELNNEGWPGPAAYRPGKGVPGLLSTPIAVHTDTW